LSEEKKTNKKLEENQAYEIIRWIKTFIFRLGQRKVEDG